MAKKKPDDDVEDSELLSDSQFDLESPVQQKSGKPIVFLIISLVFAAIVAVFALYSMELGPFAKPPPVEPVEQTPPPTVTPPPASAPVIATPPPLPKPETPPAAEAEDDPPAKGKKGKLAKKKPPKKKKKKGK